MPVVQICRYWKGMVVFMHNKTISYYNKNAKEFAERTVNADMGFCYSKFIALLHNKDYIMDAGCGSGRDSKFFLEQGFNVQAIDASMEMCKFATEYIGIPVKCMRFDEIEFDSQFNGIWANASLLHIEKSGLPDILRKFNRALKFMFFCKVCIYEIKSYKIRLCSDFLVSWKCVKIVGKSYG